MNRKKPNKRQLRRMHILKAEIGCLACLQGGEFREADYHHAYNKPEGVEAHEWGYPLCPWHHRGIGYGPGVPIAHSRKRFAAMYGTEAELVTIADQLVAEFERGIVGNAS